MEFMTPAKRLRGTRRVFVPKRNTAKKQLLLMKRKINSMSPELKLRPVQIDATNVTTSGNLQFLTAIPQGTNETERLGNKIRLRGMEINAQVVAGNATGANTKYTYSMFLVRDSQSAGAAPVVSGTAQAIFPSAGPLTPQVQYNTRDRFKIILQHNWDAHRLATGNQNNNVQFKLKFDQTVEYHDTSAAVASAGKNSYYIVFLTDDVGGTVDFSVFTNILYTDV